MVNREPRPGYSCVQVDYEKAMYDATAHLLSQGRKKIGYIAGSLQLWSAKQRLGGYIKALSDWGIGFEQELVGVGEFSRAMGARALAALLDSGMNIDGLICGNDLMAIGALSELKRRKINVPEDVAVVVLVTPTSAS